MGVEGGGGLGAIGIAMYFYLGDCSWEDHIQKKEVIIEGRNSLQVILLKPQLPLMRNIGINKEGIIPYV